MGRRAVAVQSVHAPHSRQVKAARAPRLRQVDVTATSRDLGERSTRAYSESADDPLEAAGGAASAGN